MISDLGSPHNWRAFFSFHQSRKDKGSNRGVRSFSVAAPKIWNSLPPSLRTYTSPDAFRRHLKTHYCQQAFQSTQLLSSCASDSALLTIVRVYKLYLLTYLHIMPSVLWHCWLGGRKGIPPVKNWAAGCWRGYLSGARCRLAYGPADSTATHCLLLQ